MGEPMTPIDPGMDEVDGIEVLFDTTRQRFERKDAMPSLVTKEVKLPPTVKELVRQQL